MRSIVVSPSVQVAVGAALLVLLLLVVRARLVRRNITRRIGSVVTRLEVRGSVPTDGRGLERLVARLERAADDRVLDVAEAVDGAGRLGASLDLVAEAVIVWDEHGRQVYVNKSAEPFTSARQGDVIASQALARLRPLGLAGQETTETIELFGPPRRTLVVSVSPLDDGERAIGAVAVIDDVSERRRLEAVRRDFVANIGHELKTPVGALALLAETIVGENDPAVAARLSERMTVEAQRVGRTIEDLLTLSRIEFEESPPRDPVPVHLVGAEAVERVRSAADQRDIVLEVDDPARRLTVLGDRRQLISAIYNLLENAVKYSDRGATIHLTVSEADGWIDIAVRDHGIGIPARDLERIFERFYRVDRARARDTGGTGLGLAIVRHVAGNHGGDVQVESLEGEGSTFILRLPVGPRAATVSARAG
jgi:two-component system sensor histidine kinase SenX3